MATDTQPFDPCVPFSAVERFNAPKRPMVCYFCEAVTEDGMAVQTPPQGDVPGGIVAVCLECIAAGKYSPAEEYAKTFEPSHSE